MLHSNKLVLIVALFAFSVTSCAEAGEGVLKIGFTQPLSGALESQGRAALMGVKLWADDVNHHGGLLGRQVKLIYYDDQSSVTNLRRLYEKLILTDKADFILGGYGMTAAVYVIPIAIQHNMLLPTLFSVNSNKDFEYPLYFSIGPIGPSPDLHFSEGFFRVAAEQLPRPKTVVLLGNNNDYGQEAIRGASRNAIRLGFDVLDTKLYSANLKNFRPILRDIKKQRPDILYVASFPPDTVAIIQQARELHLKPKIFGGGMVGLQYTQLQIQLGPTINGILNYSFGTPNFFDRFPGARQLLNRYRAKAKSDRRSDSLGTYVVPYSYAAAQLLENGIKNTGTLDQATISKYLAGHEVSTIVGNIRFAPNGEWDRSRLLEIQFKSISHHSKGDSIANKISTMVIEYPEAYRTGELHYPFSE